MSGPFSFFLFSFCLLFVLFLLMLQHLWNQVLATYSKTVKYGRELSWSSALLNWKLGKVRRSSTKKIRTYCYDNLTSISRQKPLHKQDMCTVKINSFFLILLRRVYTSPWESPPSVTWISWQISQKETKHNFSSCKLMLRAAKISVLETKLALSERVYYRRRNISLNEL